LYNVLLHRRHGLAVLSAVVLLRPEADGPEMTGVVHHQLPDGSRYLEFRYQVVRAWQKPVESVLAGGVGTLPLAPLSEVAPEALPQVIRRMEERIRREARPDEQAVLWTATYVLMGLRYPLDLAARLLQGVRAMKESVTYQAIVAEGLAEGLAQGRAEGAVQEAKKFLLLMGHKRFGPPGAQTSAAIEAISDLDQLEQMGERLLEASSWEELLARPDSRRRTGKRKKPS
jgi:predicted transposase YdaD